MKRFVSFLLLMFLFFPLLSRAEESVQVTLATSVPQAAPVTLSFDETWFAADARAYQHDLCRLSLGMAIAAFRGPQEEPAADILRFFDALSFADAETAQFDVCLPDSIGTAIAFRPMKDGGSLLAVAVSGGNYGDEWISNFDLGDGDLHRGFSDSARIAADRAADYARRHGLENPRIWISGYSRGAAVSNVTAALLAEDGLADDSRIFAYTFATPATVKGAPKGTHENIFNIVNAADLVPQVPPKEWGFGRYGRTLYLPTSLDANHDYAALLPAFAQAYLDLTGQVSDQGDAAFAPMAAGAAHGLALSAQNAQRYEAGYRTLLGKLFTGQELNAAEGILFGTLLLNMNNAALQSVGQSAVPLTAAGGLSAVWDALAASPIAQIFYQHMTENYAAWLLALPDGSVLLTNSLNLTDPPSI